MSNLIGSNISTLPLGPGGGLADNRAMAPWYTDRDAEMDDPAPEPIPMNVKSQKFIGEQGVDFGVGLLEPIWHNDLDPDAGTNSRFSIVGVTRDQYGSPVGGVTVKCFQTSTDILISTVVSDVNTGAFAALTQAYNDNHYLVAHKTGTPDLDGASVNTLQGA